MTKIDIFSGFLGAGKTTLIKKMIAESYKGEKLVLIENEFGEIGIDGGFLKDAGIEVSEMNSGCICCSLVGDFGIALKKVLAEFHPDRILIEPSGVGKLSDVIKATRGVDDENLILNSYTAVVDVNKCKMYIKNFGEFFCDQIKEAKCIVLSHTDTASDAKIKETVALLKEYNDNAVISVTPWSELSGTQLLEAMEGTSSIEHKLSELEEESACPTCSGHHLHHEHGEECHCHEHEHHHHEHGEECHCHEHEHHHHEHAHRHDEHCHCHGHEHGHGHEHHHHHADEVFQSIGAETTNKYSVDEMTEILSTFTDEEAYGTILRAKGIVAGKDGSWIHFDYVPGEPDVRTGSADVIGRICVIGVDVNEENVKALFKLN